MGTAQAVGVLSGIPPPSFAQAPGSELSDPGASMGDVVVQRSGSAFVGRESELARVTELFAEAADGAACGVLVGGDAGVGKTRLVTEVIAAAVGRGAATAVGRCVDLGAGGLPYLPFTEALAALAGSPGPAAEAVRTVARERPALLRLTGQVADDAAGVDDALQRLSLYDAVAVALRSAAEAAGLLVLVLEDLHWADASTRDLARFLLARLSDERVLLVGTYRADDLHRRHPLRALLAELVRLPRVERLELQPFDRGELRRYLDALHGGAVAQQVVHDIGNRSEGNAFYAAELLGAVDDACPGMLPGGLADVLLARVERLPESVQQVARVASVAGRRVPDVLLRAALGRLAAREPAGGDGVVDVNAALRDAVAHHVLVPDGADRFVFRHALLQEAVYGDLLPGDRAWLHGVFAELLAADPEGATAVDLARHSVEAHDLPGALAAWLSAAREAERRLAPAEALAHYEQVLGLWALVPDDRRPPGANQVDITIRAALAASVSGQFRRAITLGRSGTTAAAAAGDRDLEAKARNCLAEFLFDNDDEDDAMAEVQNVYALLDGLGPHPERVWAATVQARITVGRGDLWDTRREHLVANRDFVEKTLVEARQLGMVSAEANLLITLSASEGLIVGPEASSELLHEAAGRGAEAGDPEVALRVGYHLGLNALDVGDLSAARAHLVEALAAAEHVGLASSIFAIEGRLVLGQTLAASGDWDGAVRTVTTERPRVPAPESLFLQTPVLPVTAARAPDEVAGRVAELEAYPDYPFFWNMIYVPLAEAMIWLGRYEEALGAVHQALGKLRRIGRPLAPGGIETVAVGIAAIAEAAAAGAPLGRAGEEGERLLDHARQVARTGATRLRSMGPEGRAWGLRVEAENTRLAGPGAGDVDAWRAAYEAFGYGQVYETARTGRRLAEALLAAPSRASGRADRDEATRLARAARETADRLGARPLRDAVDALAARHRLDLGGGPSAPRVLTPREEEVIRLVAQGLTNREIGARLFISEKTASVHVSNVLAKLGASGRAEAVAVAHRRGLLGP